MTPRDDPSERDDQPPAEPGAAPAGETVDALFACLADARRCRLLEHLAGRSEPVDVEDVARHLSARERGTDAGGEPTDAAEGVAVSLHHVHLPKLSDAGVLAVDREAGTAGAGPRFDAATSLLEEV